MTVIIRLHTITLNLHSNVKNIKNIKITKKLLKKYKK